MIRVKWVVLLSIAISVAGFTAEVPPKPGTFSVEVSGHLALKFQGSATVFKSPGGDFGIQLIKDKNSSPVTSVLIMLPGGIKPGTHKISPYERVFDQSGEVTSVGATFSSPELVCINAEGTLTLATAGPDFSGTFKFTAQSGFQSDQKLIVQGSFSKLPME